MRSIDADDVVGIGKGADVEGLGRVSKESAGFWSRAWRRFRTNRVSLVALFIVILIVVLVLAAGLIARYITHTTYYDTSLTDKMLPVRSDGHPLGTDRLGRNELTRLAYGGRVSLRVALLATLFILLIGVLSERSLVM